MRADSDKLKDLYLEKGLSASELGTELGISKAAVLERLHDIGIRNERIGRDPDNYKFPKNPPYGYDVRNGRLVPNRIEMKVARLIVEQRDRKNLGWRVIAERLNSDGYQTKTGRKWNLDSVRNIHERWKDKI